MYSNNNNNINIDIIVLIPGNIVVEPCLSQLETNERGRPPPFIECYRTPLLCNRILYVERYCSVVPLDFYNEIVITSTVLVYDMNLFQRTPQVLVHCAP